MNAFQNRNASLVLIDNAGFEVNTLVSVQLPSGEVVRGYTGRSYKNGSRVGVYSRPVGGTAAGSRPKAVVTVLSAPAGAVEPIRQPAAPVPAETRIARLRAELAALEAAAR
jgi:hypothetical protein